MSVARLDQWDLGLLVPPFSTLVTVMLIMYAFGFTLVVIWTGHSVHKHGWRRRSLRRFSYGLFTLLLAVRLAWCTFLLLRIREHPELARSTDATAVLRSLTVIVLTRAAFCLHFLAFSMLVCGWVDSTYMMMAKPSVQPTAMRAHSALFYHIGPPFIAVNTINAVLSFGTLVPLLLWQRDDGSSALESDEPLPETVSLAQWLFALSGGGFSALLAISSTAAGLAVSGKIRSIADMEPALRSYAREKVIKVTLAAAVFSICSLSRAYVLLREALAVDWPPLGPISTVTLGVMIPELLPTVAALLVLRRQPLTCCCGGSSRSSMDPRADWNGGDACECCRDSGCCICWPWPADCWPWRGRVGHVDMRPLRTANASYEEEYR